MRRLPTFQLYSRPGTGSHHQRLSLYNLVHIALVALAPFTAGCAKVHPSFVNPSNKFHEKDGAKHYLERQNRFPSPASAGSRQLTSIGASPDADENPPPSESNEMIFNNESKSRRKYSVARAGGRKANNFIRTDVLPKVDKTEKGLVALLSQWAVPLVVLSLLLRFLFGGIFAGASNSNVVYYSRSVYQSTTYSKDGNAETIRKESFQSNMPGLKERMEETTRKNGIENMGQRSKSSYLDTNVDDELADLEDEIDTLLFRGW
mmetsp:Transcript_15770/g.30213  ORF Transcript_15770/g.30213 Transcript_15770/m.30213 type:complete len:262 (-) Transcript_15770:597-1382(-)